VCLLSASVQNFTYLDILACLSQWLRGLGHELSSFARTLESGVRIALKTWMSVNPFVLPCVLVAALRRADHLSEESYRLCKREKKDNRTEEEARAKGCRATDGWMGDTLAQ
jgi:hypothetical protein